MSSLIFRITGDPSSFNAAMGEVNGALARSASQIQRTSGGLAAFGGTLQSVGLKLSAAITLPLVGLGIGTIKAAADMDTLKRALLATTGSADQAAKQLDRLQVIAKLPGIDLPEAVRGSIRLQNYGFSAGLAEKALKVFSNAVAGAGGTADDTAESLRQLGQMYGRGKVTMDNLRIILERVPQAAAVIRKEWGSEALADPSKAFEKLGLTSSQVIETLIDRMGDIPQTTAGVKTAIENLNQEITKSAARIGDHLVPAVIAVIPHLESMAEAVADAADGFMRLPSPIRNTGLALVGLTAALPVIIVALGTVASNVAALRIAFAGASISLKGFAGAFSLVGTAAVGAGAAVAYLMNLLITNRQSTVDTTAKSIDELNKKLGYGTPAAFGSGTEAILGYMRVLAPAEKAVASVGKAHEAASASVGSASNVIKVSSVAGLIYVESLERVKTAVGKVKDAMYEWSIQGTIQGKQLETQRSAIQGLTFDYGKLGPAIQTALDGLNMMSTIRPPQIEINNDNLRRGSVFEVDDILGRAGSSSTRQQSSKVSQLEADLARVKQLNAEGKATGNDVIAIQQALKKAMEETGKVATVSGTKQKTAIHQVSLVINDLGQGLTDLIFKGGKLGDVLVSAATLGAKSITRLLIEGTLTKLSTKLLEVGGLMGTVFSGGTGVIKSAVPALSPAINAAGGIGGGIGGAVGGASGGLGSLATAANPITAMVTAVSSVVSAVSAVVANFQFAAMNKTLDLIEREVRYTKIYTGDQGQSILWSTQTTAARLLLANATLDSIAAFSSEMLGNLQQLNQRGGSGGSGNTYVFQPAGGYYTSDSALRDLFDQFARYMKAQGA